MDISKAIKNIPFLFVTPIVVLGVICSENLSFDSLIFNSLFCILLVVGYFFPRILLIPLLFLFGVFLTQNTFRKSIPCYEEHFGRFAVINKSNKTDFVARLISLDSIGYSDEKIVLIVPLHSKFNPKNGDTIATRVNIETLRDSHLVGKRDYLNAQINYFAKIYPDSLTLTFGNPIIEDTHIFESLKAWINSRVDLLNITSQSKAILKSMIIGDKSTLKYETKQKFQICGVSHFLAISGWHIGLLFLFLNLVIYLSWFRYGKYLKSLIIISVIWFYAAMVGFSPSVCRAAVMFTMFQYVLFGELKRNARYNIIFASFFLFVCFDHEIIHNIGFQLSYLAVLSIQMFYNRILNLIYSRFKLLNYLSQSIALFLSVQILLLPIILYYFGYYSLVSLVPNLLLSILFPVAILLTVLFIVIPINPLNIFVSYVFEQITQILDYFSALDYISLNYYLSIPYIFIYYLLVLLVVLIFEKD